jgi:hypothetical protein
MNLPSDFLVRRCNANPAAWTLVRLRPDGAESSLACDRATAMRIRDLIEAAVESGLVQDGDKIAFRIAPTS